MTKWFIAKNEEVSGPYSTEAVQAKVSQGSILGDDWIWSRNLNSWKTISWWLCELPNLAKQDLKPEEEEVWHYAVNDNSFGPLSRVQLISELYQLPNQKGILLWTKGMKAWTPVYEFFDIMDEIGVNRRQFPRASINGNVVVKVDNQTILGKLSTISEGGFGVSGVTQLSSGQHVHAEIKTPHFPNSIHIKAVVQYATSRGFVGFKFENIHMEAKSSIIEYVKGSGLSNAA